ncbi:hypothetical protein [Metapseudomonas otitidis]|uniref:hypothetical protein n=1 Tax=Metapseudomonas otitidis TaxID=319939 RepID=UPI0008ECF4A3|nr:hypothetical protein [Pseudomonas otitidis]MBO2930928.1 hypothetical protein [Pseudomonas otitidis]WAF83713.1 hypothetical protein NRL37_16555 [Pseudomonas otitidis]SFA45258.1 hypothetical protein SAMN05216263_102286 [Pseudomonas otitidis]
MPLAAEHRRLAALADRLVQVLTGHEWEALAPLDAQIARCLHALRQQGHVGVADCLVCRRMRRLHQQAQRDCRTELRRLERQLSHDLDAAEGRQAYLTTDCQTGA